MLDERAVLEIARARGRFWFENEIERQELCETLDSFGYRWADNRRLTDWVPEVFKRNQFGAYAVWESGVVYGDGRHFGDHMVSDLIQFEDIDAEDFMDIL